MTTESDAPTPGQPLIDRDQDDDSGRVAKTHTTDPGEVKEAKPTDRHNAITYKTILREWRWEFSAWMTGTVALAVILILLALFQNQPVRKWKSKIQIRAIIAALGQLAQSAQLVPIASCIGQLKWSWFRKARRTIDIDKYDLASRGPAGSVELLYHFGLGVHLVSIGAICTILLATFSTFIQQSVQTGLKQFEVEGATVTIFRGSNLSIQNNTYIELDNNNDKFEFSNPQVVGTVNAGLFSSGVSLSDVNGTCPTGNCDWPSYTTLAICSSTEDITSTISKAVLDTSELASHGGRSITFWTKVFYLSADTSGQYGPFRINASSGLETPDNTDTNLPDLADIYTVYWDPCSDSAFSVFGDDISGYRAYKGRLQVCLQTLSSSTDPSQSYTKVLEEKTDITWDLSSDGICTTDSHTQDKYCIDFAEVIGRQIGKSFNGSAALGSTEFALGSTDFNIFYTESMTQMVTDIVGDDPAKCANDAEHQFTGFKRRIDNLAASITNSFRTADDSTPVNGTAYMTEQYIFVNFIWLILPISLWGVITAFFFATVFQTSGLPPWKSSPLVLLRCQVSDNGLNSTRKIEKDAKSSSMRLEDEGTGWLLVDQKGSGQ